MNEAQIQTIPGVHTGGCLCGRVRFEAVGEPSRTVHCHCFFCRRQTGAAVATFAGFSVTAGFRWTRGSPATYKSSPTVTRRFCRRCGTPLTFEADRHADEIYIGIGTFDEPDRLPPRAHTHVSHKISWFETADPLPRFAAEEIAAEEIAAEEIAAEQAPRAGRR